MPDWKPHIRSRLASLRLSPTRENEIVEELSQHLEDRWQELVAGGASEDEATRLALHGFRDGNRLAQYMTLLRQAHAPEPISPGAPGTHALSDLWQDLRHGARTLRRQPAFTATAVLTLALGLGANAAMFSIINGVLLRPLPFPNAAQLMALNSRFLPSSGTNVLFSALSSPEFADIRSRVDAYAHVAAYQFSNRNLTHSTGEPERVLTMAVTAEFFDVLQVKPLRGRVFTEDEAQRRGTCVALVGDARTGAAFSDVGSTIRLDTAPCEVVGVLPPGFWFRDDRVRVWTALALDAVETPINRGSHGLLAVARLRDGVNVERAEAQLQSLRASWAETFPDHYAKGHLAVSRPLHEAIVGNQRDTLLILGGAVVFVLLIVCVNLAALLISAGEARRREFAMRHALGANRRRLIRQLVAEALLLAATGGVVGVVLAHALLVALLALYPARLPGGQAITIDFVTVLYTGALAIVTGLVVGAVPALNATGRRMHDTLRADSRTATASRRAVAARAALVVSQLALSVILLAGAMLLIRSYQRLQQVDLGFDSDRVLTFEMLVPPGRQPDPAAARRTLAAVEDRLASTPGVEGAGMISGLPLVSSGGADSFVIEGRVAPPPGAPAWNARYLMATPRLFPVLAIPLKRGRLLADSDVPERPLVAVINETAARLYWSNDDAIGRTIRYYPQETSPSIQIVGIVGDVRSLGPAEPAPPAVYVPFAQAPRPPYEGRAMTFIVRTSGDPSAIVASARAAVTELAPGLPLANVRPMREVVSVAGAQPRFTTFVMSFFAGTAFLLAGLGLYGVLACGVEQRTREMGVRIALGAGRREIFRLVVGGGMGFALMGILVGIPAALALTRLMKGVLSEVTSNDPVTYIAVVAILGTVAFLASYLPARRATRVDPLVALRSD